MQVNIHEAKTQLSRLLQLVEQGEKVFIARDGHPVAELVRVAKRPFRLGSGRGDPLVNQEVASAAADIEWWRMTSEEIAEWTDGPIAPPDEPTSVSLKRAAKSKGKS